MYYISFIFIKFFPELRKVVKWLSLLMIVSRFAVNFFVFICSNSMCFIYFVSNLTFLTKKYMCKYVQSFVNEFFLVKLDVCNLTDFFSYLNLMSNLTFLTRKYLHRVKSKKFDFKSWYITYQVFCQESQFWHKNYQQMYKGF